MEGLMHQITSIPVTTPDGNLIGKAVLEVDEGGNVRAHMTLDSALGRELMKMMEVGVVEGLSFGPVIMPAMKAPGRRVEGVEGVPIRLPANLPPEHIPSNTGWDNEEVVGNGRLGADEIESRFGFHKASIEGPNATVPKHTEARKSFKAFARWLDKHSRPGREKDLAMVRLEEASMWFHKAIAKEAPIGED